MTDSKKKKQLLDENKDIYISDYDKSLSYDALNRIIGAKKDFVSAAKENNKEKMTTANNVANAVRAQYGNYTGGMDGSEYHPFQYTEDYFDDYESEYEDDLDRLYKKVMEKSNSFEYNYEKDPVYKAYEKIYNQQGNLAYERALAQNSLKTGGMLNTNAQSAAMQALNYYSSRLSEKIPELYKAAYDRYYTEKKDNYTRLKDAYDMISKRESRDYDRYADEQKRKESTRDFMYKQKNDIADRLFTMERDELNNLHDIEKANLNAENTAKNNLEKSLLSENAKKQQLAYDILRDVIDDEKWRWQFNMNANKNEYPKYNGTIGNGDILSYARKLFGNENLTLEDLYNIMGL